MGILGDERVSAENFIYLGFYCAHVGDRMESKDLISAAKGFVQELNSRDIKLSGLARSDVLDIKVPEDFRDFMRKTYNPDFMS